MQIITSPQVSERAVLDALRAAFTEVARAATALPGQFVVDLPGGGDVIHYPAVLAGEGVYAVKVSPYLPQPEGPAVVTAWTMLVSLTTGQPVALLDSTGLTMERTAATSVLAADLLLPAHARTAAVVGYGAAGRAHARYLRQLRPDMTIRVWSRSQPVPADDPVEAAASIEAAVDGADLVMLCTSAAADVLDPRTLPAGTVVTSISTNAPGAREIPADAVAELDVYVDAPPSLTVATELTQAAAAGWDQGTVRGDLAALVAGTATAPSGRRPVYFRSVGLGIEDAAVAWVAAQHPSTPTAQHTQPTQTQES